MDDVQLTAKIGGTFNAQILLYEDTAQTTPYPTSGWTWELTIDRISDPFTESAGLTVVDGSVTLKVNPAITATLEECETDFVLKQTSSTDDTEVYFPVTGSITWELP